MKPLEPLLPGETRTKYLDRLERQDKHPASQNCVEVASLVRQIIIDTLKSSAPGISEQMRQAIANSVAIKLRSAQGNMTMAFTREQNRLLEETHDQPRLPVKPWNIRSAIEQIQKCQFECEGGPLENNDAWRWIIMTYGVEEPRTGAGSLD